MVAAVILTCAEFQNVLATPVTFAVQRHCRRDALFRFAEKWPPACHAGALPAEL